jgi:hypothetical protein
VGTPPDRKALNSAYYPEANREHTRASSGRA